MKFTQENSWWKMEILLGILVIFSTLTLWRLNKFTFEPLIFIITFELIAIISLLLSWREPFVIRGGGLPPIYTSPEMFHVTTKLFSSASLSFFCGVFLINLFWRKDLNLKVQNFQNIDSRDIDKFSKVFLIAMYLILFLYLFNVGNILIHRNTYLYNLGGSLNGNIHYYLPIFSVVSAYLAIKSSKKGYRFLLLIYSTVCALESFSSASRGITVQLAAITFIVASQRIRWRWRISILILGTSLTVWFTSLVLKLRTLSEHGLVPYLSAILNNTTNLNVDLTEFIGNFLSIIPTTFLGVQIIPPQNMLLVQISPFTGRSNGWYEMAGALMVNPATPSGALAQIGSLGTLTAFFTWFILGIVIALLGRINKATSIFEEQKFVSYVLVLGAMVQMLQYSLRIGMRFLYLNLITMMLFKLYTLTFARRLSQ